MEKYLKMDRKDTSSHRKDFERYVELYISKVLNEPLAFSERVFFHITSRCNTRCKICNIPIEANINNLNS